MPCNYNFQCLICTQTFRDQYHLRRFLIPFYENWHENRHQDRKHNQKLKCLRCKRDKKLCHGDGMTKCVRCSKSNYECLYESNQGDASRNTRSSIPLLSDSDMNLAQQDFLHPPKCEKIADTSNPEFLKAGRPNPLLPCTMDFASNSIANTGLISYYIWLSVDLLSRVTSSSYRSGRRISFEADDKLHTRIPNSHALRPG